MTKGYFGIGVENLKTAANLGSLWRSAHSLGAAFIFTVGRRYQSQASDTSAAYQWIPLFQYATMEDCVDGLPRSCPLVGIEFPHQDAQPLPKFVHPARASYLLGGEDCGLSKTALAKCHKLVYIPCGFCLNVAVAGSVVMYDRVTKKAGGSGEAR